MRLGGKECELEPTSDEFMVEGGYSVGAEGKWWLLQVDLVPPGVILKS